MYLGSIGAVATPEGRVIICGGSQLKEEDEGVVSKLYMIRRFIQNCSDEW